MLALNLLEWLPLPDVYLRTPTSLDEKSDAHIALELVEVKIREQTLAEDYPDRLASQNALAGAYQANRKVAGVVNIEEHPWQGDNHHSYQAGIVDQAPCEAVNPRALLCRIWRPELNLIFGTWIGERRQWKTRSGDISQEPNPISTPISCTKITAGLLSNLSNLCFASSLGKRLSCPFALEAGLVKGPAFISARYFRFRG